MSATLVPIQDRAPVPLGVRDDAPHLLPDKALPQLGTVRDTSIMKHFLQRALGGAGSRYRIEDCTITYIRYWPGETCSIIYAVAVRDAATGQENVQRLFARVLPPGLSQNLFSEALRGVLAASPLCDPVIHLSDLGMVIWLFPNDPKLNGLHSLLDANWLRDSVLPRLAAKDYGPDWTISTWHTEVVSYVPEHRCTLRAVVQLQHRMTGELRTRAYYGKAYPDHTGLATKRNMDDLRRICTGPFAPFRVPRPLLYQKECRTLWQAGVAGMPLYALQAGSAELLDSLRLTGRVIAALHGSGLALKNRCRPESPLDLLARASEILSHAEHDATSLPERLAGAARRPGISSCATVHRDLHLNNILSTHEGITLIDLDDIAVGDPVEDIARFIAHLCSLSMSRGLESQQIEPMIRAVVQSYCSAAPWRIDEGEFRWHLAAALIYQQACRCVTRPRKRRLANLNKIIRLAERIGRGVVL